MRDLEGFVIALLYHTKRKGHCDLSYIEDKPLKNLLEKLAVHPHFNDVFEVEIAENLICSCLYTVMSQGKISFNNSDAIQFLNDLYESLKVNVNEYWIIFPLKGASLTQTIRYKDFVFITGDSDEKINVLTRLGKTTRNKAVERATHTRISRSEHFFLHPLLAIRINHQNNYVRNVAKRFSFYSNSILQAIYWGKVHPKYEPSLIHNGFGIDNANHLLIYGKKDSQISHMPADFDTTCKLDLDFLNEPTYIKLFSAIFDELMYKGGSGERIIVNKFLNGFKFLKNAIDLERKRQLYQGLSIPLLLLTTASESILLKREDQKRSRLSVLYSRLVKMDNLLNTEIAEILHKIYGWRSEFVHGGTEIHKDFNEDFSDGVTTNTYINYKKFLANLLSKTVYFISLVERRSQGQTMYSKEEIWYKYLNNQWKKGKSILKKT
ncbi:hypothetical protein [Planococcus shixiaomingii]|uniref:hypothetical protein n=1 Tax=Planococcus shixiaomingii TaxID=3058393 RepID=UPI00261D6FF6|nr:hypothetical protein [Planococcus sp. N022]WKA53430.1 hypothetical protein QWY21_12245 [Planococcus sp. N022]